MGSFNLLQSWSPTMKPILVGIAGGAGSGKKYFASQLYYLLRQYAVAAETVEVDCNHPTGRKTYPESPTASCILYHGLTIFEDCSLVKQLDVKVFLDVPADLRVANLLEKEHKHFDIYSAHEFHMEHVAKQKKYADIWMQEITPEKLKLVADTIMKLRQKLEEQPTNVDAIEPEEVQIYLDRYPKAPDTPVPQDFL